jgi:hypothetical protein
MHSLLPFFPPFLAFMHAVPFLLTLNSHYHRIFDCPRGAARSRPNAEEKMSPSRDYGGKFSIIRRSDGAASDRDVCLWTMLQSRLRRELGGAVALLDFVKGLVPESRIDEISNDLIVNMGGSEPIWDALEQQEQEQEGTGTGTDTRPGADCDEARRCDDLIVRTGRDVAAAELSGRARSAGLDVAHASAAQHHPRQPRDRGEAPASAHILQVIQYLLSSTSSCYDVM